MDSFTNIAAYRFAPLGDLKELRERLLRDCRAWDLRGSILLSTEGINLFVAGPSREIGWLLAHLRAIPGLEGLEPKFSTSDHQPFRRMLVRIKKEIIAFGVEGIAPGLHTSPKLPPGTLKQWLDEGRPVTLLDTRNDYEVKMGTFKGALAAGIQNFRDFPEAVRKMPESLKKQPIVMFCTGGIRCEKAGPFMEREGFSEIFQLEGGILKYFEECGGSHYEGECFVFDKRVGLDPALQETRSAQCFRCQTPLTEEDQASPLYHPPESCPYCHRTPEAKAAAELQRRHEMLQEILSPLPGSIPYDNHRPIGIPPAFDGARLIDALSGILDHIPREELDSWCAGGRILSPDLIPVGADHRVRVGHRYLHWLPATVEPDISPDIRILHEDEAIVVINKPAPLPLHPCGRFNRNTLQFILHRLYHPQRPRPAHRLDANTTGVTVFTRTRHFAGRLQPQFARGLVEKIYLVRVSGSPAQDTFECNADISEEAGELGSRETVSAGGLPAHTSFQVLRRLADGTTLLEARLTTGRTNQIRVHLWHLGLPVCGDPAYLPGDALGQTQTLPCDAPPLCLHSWRLAFLHPLTGERVSFEAPPPAWAR